VAFGRDNTSRDGETLISDGHKSDKEFYGKSGGKGHHHHDGKGGGRGADRGKYTG